MKSINDYFETVLTNMDCDLAVSFEKGIIRNFVSYVRRESHDVIEIKDKKLFVPENFITDDYIAKYYEKSNDDFSAAECFYLAIRHVGMPAEEELSKGSAVKRIREIITSEYKEVAYVKRVNGKTNIICVIRKYALEIASSKAVTGYLRNQVRKAENRDVHADQTAWKAYEFEKEKIARLDMANMSGDSDLAPLALSRDQRTALMVEAIFNTLFTRYDFQKFAQYNAEMVSLEDDWDFGERYQELDKIFSTPNFNGEFYQLKSEFLDALAEKIANKIKAIK